MVCEWFSFLAECDIPNWFTLIIEIILGTILALIFFSWQWNIRRRRRDAGQAQMLTHLIFLKNKLIEHEKVLNNFFDKKISVDELSQDKNKRNYSLNQLQNSISLYHDTMDSEIFRKLDEIIDYASWNTVNNREIEIKHNQAIIKKIENLQKIHFKNRAKYAEELMMKKSLN